MRIFLVNDYLFKCKIVVSNFCDFCNNLYKGRLEHLFWSCHYVQIIWNNLLEFLEHKNQDITIYFEIVSFRKRKMAKNKCNQLLNIIHNFSYFLNEN